ncbi:MAG: hypothetical protein GX755_04300 [Syntrophomonadaceae bacterium]|nr:hypothetical protein [Syntrophomonadaceae bacterium]
MKKNRLIWLGVLITAGLIAWRIIGIQPIVNLDQHVSWGTGSARLMKKDQTEKLLDKMLRVSETSFYKAQVSGWTRLTIKTQAENKTQTAITEGRLKQLITGKIQPLISNNLENELNQKVRLQQATQLSWGNQLNQYDQLEQLVNNCLNVLAESPRPGSMAVDARLKSGCLATVSARIIADQEMPHDSTIYLVITVKEIGSISEALAIKQEVGRVLSGLAQEAQKLTGMQNNSQQRNFGVKTALTLTAYQDNQISLPDQQAIINQMFRAAEANQPSGLLDNDLISLTAYTPELMERETVAGMPVNLQIAARYHQHDQRTYFQIGIPLLMTEY